MPQESRSSPRQIQAYLGRVSGPLLDRIDIHVEVPAVPFRDLASLASGETSAQIRARETAARQQQLERFIRRPRLTCNARMHSRDLRSFCAIDDDSLGLLKAAMSDAHLSARAFDRILKVARTIADLAGSDRIASEHVCEAIQYRSLDRQLWT